MFIHAISSYLPTQVIPNEYFTQLNGLSDEWITARTGISERRRTAPGENTATMGLAAVDRLLPQLHCPAADIDLIVGATYTPYDTIVTLAHAIQHHIGVADVPVVSLSSACSSLLNAIELVQGYFAMKKARRALVVVSDNNTAYNNETDPSAGHLWGCLLYTSPSPRD